MGDRVTKAERSRIMACVKAVNTGPEILVRRLVSVMGFRYRQHDNSLPGTPDLVFRRLRKVINVSGCFWHMHDCGRCRLPASNREYWQSKLRRNVDRDKLVQQALHQGGWGLLVVWECEVGGRDLNALIRRI